MFIWGGYSTAAIGGGCRGVSTVSIDPFLLARFCLLCRRSPFSSAINYSNWAFWMPDRCHCYRINHISSGFQHVYNEVCVIVLSYGKVDIALQNQFCMGNPSFYFIVIFPRARAYTVTERGNHHAGADVPTLCGRFNSSKFLWYVLTECVNYCICIIACKILCFPIVLLIAIIVISVVILLVEIWIPLEPLPADKIAILDGSLILVKEIDSLFHKMAIVTLYVNFSHADDSINFYGVHRSCDNKNVIRRNKTTVLTKANISDYVPEYYALEGSDFQYEISGNRQ